MTKDEAFKLVVDEALSGRNYYSCENYFDEEAVIRLALALKVLGVNTEVMCDEVIKVVP